MIITIDETSVLERLDKFLVQKIPGLSRAEVKRQIQAGAVKVNGMPTRKGLMLRGGDEIEISARVINRPREIIPNSEVDFAVLYEDNDLLIVEKPAGIPCHPLRTEEHWTLANGLVAKYPDLKGIGFNGLQPGLLNRIDTMTSGLLLVARNNEVFTALRTMFKTGEVKKGYQALVHGKVTCQGEIDLFISPHPTRRDRVKVISSQEKEKKEFTEARRARTRIRILRYIANYTLLEVLLITGVRHQIRAQLSYLRHPIVGDSLYGSEACFKTEDLGRYFLHANYLGFRHPRSGKWTDCHSPLPPELRAYLDKISSVEPFFIDKEIGKG
ncbi:MAG: RluA family pseudouridine synthase [Candidatus Tectomicrobia bacterium]|uniref:Pseudouridine synthase n=1 Tax=Tectimicrobiota bacterium TaxID=2528274 RepID=A0A933LQ20_UNCTE|nr:RluA family pseudouridine synthase [Candidatus Tectomicrobia bacterium]